MGVAGYEGYLLWGYWLREFLVMGVTGYEGYY